MELSLQSYFDIGVSYGLGDAAFEMPDEATVPDILGIGIRNPLGLGIRHKLDEMGAIVALWRCRAIEKVDAPEMELGYDGLLPDDGDTAFEEFKNQLRDLIRLQPLKSLELTIFGIGVVFLRMDFSAGIPERFLVGFGQCFEFAAYRMDVSDSLLEVARQVAASHLRRARHLWWQRDTGIDIQGLSKRPAPEIQQDEKGYMESRLFSAFTHIAICLHEEDDVNAIKQRLLPKKGGTCDLDSTPLHFEYHGTIHFNWAACVIVPRYYRKPKEPPELQIRRMLACIQIAHIFLGACEAFQNLFLHETMRQAEGFIKGQQSGLNHIELNRLRTLALAVVSLTRFESITQATEDRAYFAAFDQNARLSNIHEIILSRSQVLLNVQEAEADREQARRDDNLNTAVIFLTGFAVISTLWDVYEFLKGEGRGLRRFELRFDALTGITLALMLILLLISRKIRHNK
jgi:hypothetical protein